MATFDYVDIPPLATRLQPASPSSSHHTRPETLTLTALPSPHPEKPPAPMSLPTSPAKSAAFNLLPQMLLSSSMQPPPTSPAGHRGAPVLLSTRDPLSIPITTVNFRRFVTKSGPMFWLQDRVEEIVMWRNGWKVTAVWMSVYAFLCYFPRLVLLLPHAVLLGIMLSTHPSLAPSNSSKPIPVPTEGTVDWQANVQAIQNLMGAISDLYDMVVPFVPHLTHSSPYTSFLLTLTFATLIMLLPIVPLLPIRLLFLVVGLSPFLLTHPFTRLRVLPLLFSQSTQKYLHARLVRVLDDDNLEDKHWRTEMREVELWENERWGYNAGLSGSGIEKGTVGWGKGNLRPGERSAWTRGRDGWSGVQKDGSDAVSSNLTFSLAPGWCFVETEDWRADIQALWISPVGADANGWVYTNDAWLDPRPVPWKMFGQTRRRRWVRRIYYKP